MLFRAKKPVGWLWNIRARDVFGYAGQPSREAHRSGVSPGSHVHVHEGAQAIIGNVTPGSKKTWRRKFISLAVRPVQGIWRRGEGSQGARDCIDRRGRCIQRGKLCGGAELFQQIVAMLFMQCFGSSVVSRIFRTFDQATAPVCITCGW